MLVFVARQLCQKYHAHMQLVAALVPKNTIPTMNQLAHLHNFNAHTDIDRYVLRHTERYMHTVL